MLEQQSRRGPPGWKSRLQLVSMTRKIAVAEAKAKLSELMARVAHGGERVVIQRHGKPVAALVSIADLETVEATAVGERDPWTRLLGCEGTGVPDELIDRMVQLIYAERERNVTPPPDLTSD